MKISSYYTNNKNEDKNLLKCLNLFNTSAGKHISKSYKFLKQKQMQEQKQRNARKSIQLHFINSNLLFLDTQAMIKPRPNGQTYPTTRTSARIQQKQNRIKTCPNGTRNMNFQSSIKKRQMKNNQEIQDNAYDRKKQANTNENSQQKNININNFKFIRKRLDQYIRMQKKYVDFLKTKGEFNKKIIL